MGKGQFRLRRAGLNQRRGLSRLGSIAGQSARRSGSVIGPQPGSLARGQQQGQQTIQTVTLQTLDRLNDRARIRNEQERIANQAIQSAADRAQRAEASRSSAQLAQSNLQLRRELQQQQQQSALAQQALAERQEERRGVEGGREFGLREREVTGREERADTDLDLALERLGLSKEAAKLERQRFKARLNQDLQDLRFREEEAEFGRRERAEQQAERTRQFEKEFGLSSEIESRRAGEAERAEKIAEEDRERRAAAASPEVKRAERQQAVQDRQRLEESESRRADAKDSDQVFPTPAFVDGKVRDNKRAIESFQVKVGLDPDFAKAVGNNPDAVDMFKSAFRSADNYEDQFNIAFRAPYGRSILGGLSEQIFPDNLRAQRDFEEGLSRGFPANELVRKIKQEGATRK